MIGNALWSSRPPVDVFTDMESEIKAKDKEIHDLKEQVASLQRALAHNRDRDSVVDG